MSAGAGRSTQTAELVLTATNQTDRAFQQATANMDKMGRAFERSAANQSVLFQRAAGGVAGLERRLTAATAAMSFGEVLRSSVTEFAAIDRRMTRLGQNAEQSKQTIGNMKAELIKLATETGQSVQSIFEGFETYVQQTGDYDKAVANIRSIAIANQALDAEMKDTAQTARVLNDNLKFDPKDMMGAFEIFAQATRMGKFEAKDFAANMPVLAQAMNQAGMTGKKGLAEMAAVMELIARKSPDNERAVLGFRDLITKAFGTEVENHFKAAGSTLQGHLSNTLKNGGSVLSTIASQTRRTLESIALAETGDKSKYMSFIGRLFPEEDSRRAATAIIEYFSEVGPMMEKIQSGTGEVSKRFNQVKDDASSALERIGIKWFELKQQIGKSLVDVGVLSGMDKFSKDIDDAIRSVGALGDAITRIEQQRNKNGLLGGIGQTFKEIGSAAIGGMHAELERVTRYNLERATRNGQKARIKAKQARDEGRMNDAGGYDNEADSEEARAKRLAYQLKHGFDMERLFGNSDERVQGSFRGAVGDAMRMGEDPGAVKRAQGLLPPERQGTINTGPALPAPVDPNSAEGMRARLDALKADMEAVKRAQIEVERARRAVDSPRFDARKRAEEDAAAEAERRAHTRRMAPEIAPIPQAPPINRAPDHVPGGLVDPYAPPPGWHPSAFEGGQDIASMIQRASLIDRTGATTDTSGPTARGQQDQIRLTEETNGILRRLVTTAGYSGGGGLGGGAGLGGLGGGGGGNSPGTGGFQRGGGGDGAGGVAGGTVPGSDARHPFGGGGRRGGDQPADDGPTQDVPGALNPRLAGSRKALMDELDRDPSLKRDVIKTASMENRGSAFKMQAVLESMVNRAKMNGYRSLRQAIHSGFYGPVNRGGLAGGLSEKDRRDGEAALEQVKNGSNAIGYRTDQGMLTDPGARRYMQEPDHSGHQKIGGENFFYMGQKGREWARRQAAADAAAGVEASPRAPFTPGSAGANPPGASGSAEGLRIKGAQATGGGASEGGVFDLARAAQGDLPGGVKHFSAFNDHYHQGTGSKHAAGLAFDTSLNDPGQSPQAAEAMRAKLRAAGLSDADFKVIDEYRNPSARSTGGHIHTQFNTREAARRYAEYARGARAQMQAQDKAEKAQVAAIPRSPFTPGSAVANPPGDKPTPLGEAGQWKSGGPASKPAAKNAFGGEALNLTKALGPDKPAQKNAFGGATDLGPREGAESSFGEFQGGKRRVPLPPRRPDINAPGPGTPLPPVRPAEFKAKVKPVEPPGITREVKGGNGKIYGALERSPLPPRRPDIEAETAAIKAHREEAEKPIKLRYHSDGLQPRNTHSESIALRRANDASMRYARQNSYSDTGVA